MCPKQPVHAHPEFTKNIPDIYYFHTASFAMYANESLIRMLNCHITGDSGLVNTLLDSDGNQHLEVTEWTYIMLDCKKEIIF